MRGVTRRRRNSLVSAAAAALSLAIMGGCQTQPAGAQSAAPSSRGKPVVLKPVKDWASCQKPALVDAGSSATTISTCTKPAQEGNLSPDAFAYVRLNLGLAYLAKSPPNVTEARRLLEGATIETRVSQAPLQAINRALADVYIASGSEADLELALQKLGQNSDLASLRRRTEILALKSAPDRARLEDLRNWQQAATNYSITASNEAGRNPSPAARAELNNAEGQVALASQRLGEYYLAEANKQAPFAADSAAARDSAIASLREATRALASSQGADVRTRRGKAQLQLAGYEGPARRSDFNCEPGQANPNGLIEAGLTLTGIASAEAKSLLGCVLQAQGKLGDAIQTLREAASTAPAGSVAAADYSVLLGNAQRSNGATAANRADAVASYEAALRIYEAGLEAAVEPEKSQRKLKVAKTHFALGALRSQPGASAQDLDSAQCHYLTAIKQDDGFAEAYLEYGKYFYNRAKREGASARVSATCPNSAPVTGDNMGLALSNLARADATAAARDNRYVRNEAKYYQSRMLTEFRRNKTDDLIQASTLSKEASDAAIGEWKYREQHCLTRIALGTTYLQTESRPYCANATIETADGYALQGVYYLRRAQAYARLSPDALEELADAEASFQRGLNALEREGANTRPADQRALLQAKLRIGRGTAKYCAIQKETGDQEIAQARSENPDAADKALKELDIYLVRSCDGSKVAR